MPINSRPCAGRRSSADVSADVIEAAARGPGVVQTAILRAVSHDLLALTLILASAEAPAVATLLDAEGSRTGRRGHERAAAEVIDQLLDLSASRPGR